MYNMTVFAMTMADCYLVCWCAIIQWRGGTHRLMMLQAEVVGDNEILLNISTHLHKPPRGQRFYLEH